MNMTHRGEKMCVFDMLPCIPCVPKISPFSLDLSLIQKEKVLISKSTLSEMGEILKVSIGDSLTNTTLFCWLRNAV